MRGIRQQYGVELDEVLASVRALFDASREVLGAFSVRSALVQTSATTENLLTVAVGHASGEVVTAKAPQDCGCVHLREATFEPGPFIEALCARSQELSVGSDPPFPMKGHRFSIGRVPSKNPLSAWPGLLVYGERLDKPGLPGFNLFDPVASPGGTFYPDVWTAAASWTELRGFNLGNDTRAFGTVLFVPDARARLVSFDAHVDRIVVQVDVRASATARWKLVAGLRGERYRNLAFDLVDGATEIPVDAGARTVQVAITTNAGEIVDFFRPEYTGESGHTIAIVDPPDASLAETVTALIAAGESETTEFKTFVDPGDGKMDEIARTVVAFSNTSGGYVIVGVRDDGKLEDLARAPGMKKWAKEEIVTEDLVRRYASALRQRAITSCSSPTPMVRPAAVEVYGAWTAVLVVERGPTPPYSFRDGQVTVRRGATTRLAHPEREPEMFSGHGAGDRDT